MFILICFWHAHLILCNYRVGGTLKKQGDCGADQSSVLDHFRRGLIYLMLSEAPQILDLCNYLLVDEHNLLHDEYDPTTHTMSNQENPTSTIWFDVPCDGGVHNTTQSLHIFDGLPLRLQNCGQDSQVWLLKCKNVKGLTTFWKAIFYRSRPFFSDSIRQFVTWGADVTALANLDASGFSCIGTFNLLYNMSDRTLYICVISRKFLIKYYEYSFNYLIIIMSQLWLTCYLVYSTDLRNLLNC